MSYRKDEAFEIHKITGLPYETCVWEWTKKNMFSDKKKSFNPGIEVDYSSLIGGVRGRPTKNEVLNFMVKDKGYSYDGALFKINKSLFLSGGGSAGNARFVVRGI